MPQFLPLCNTDDNAIYLMRLLELNELTVENVSKVLAYTWVCFSLISANHFIEYNMTLVRLTNLFAVYESIKWG